MASKQSQGLYIMDPSRVRPEVRGTKFGLKLTLGFHVIAAG